MMHTLRTNLRPMLTIIEIRYFDAILYAYLTYNFSHVYSTFINIIFCATSLYVLSVTLQIERVTLLVEG